MRLILTAACLALAAACAPPSAQQLQQQQETLIHAVIETGAGDIVVTLYPDRAPVSVANFVAHARAGTYNGGAFYRAVRENNDPNPDPSKRIDVIQGGWGYGGMPEAAEIAHETTAQTGLSHVAGALSMGRLDPGTASTEFFIVVNDSTSLDSGPGGRNPDEQGYAVFGMVAEGMDVAHAIWRAPTGDEAPGPFVAGQILDPVIPIRQVRILEEE
ncbi:MAG: peptidylprolyl isomerase [Maricaulaceae bacterium]|nr:peptidylprolyl isomerase [Maricaulaceae bacterium]